jgi:copper chaperone CopZ
MARVAAVLLLAMVLAIGCSKPKAWDPSLEKNRAECTLGLSLPNMACSEACPIKVQQALSRVRGVEEVEVDYDSRTATVHASWPACGAEGYEQMIGNLYQRGYRARIVSAH